MRRIGYFLSFVLCTVVLIGFSTIDTENAYCGKNPVYLGEYCWVAENGFLRTGITHMGDRHLFGCGSAVVKGYKFAINGNFEVTESSLLLTFTDSVSYDEFKVMYSRVGNATLDIDTLDGTSSIMNMIWEGGETFVEHTTDSLFSVPCDKNLSPDGVDKREELKTLLKSFVTTPE